MFQCDISGVDLQRRAKCYEMCDYNNGGVKRHEEDIAGGKGTKWRPFLLKT